MLKVGDEFDNFDDFMVELNELAKATNTKFTVVNSKSIEKANQYTPSRHMNEKLKYIFCTFGCIHRGIFATRSCGIRKTLSRVARTDCRAVVRVSINRRRQVLIVREVYLHHNHDMGSNKMKVRKLEGCDYFFDCSKQEGDAFGLQWDRHVEFLRKYISKKEDKEMSVEDISTQFYFTTAHYKDGHLV